VLRSPEKVVEDLVKLRELGVLQASISWDLAELERDYWETVLPVSAAKTLKIGLYNEFFQMPNLEFVDALARTLRPRTFCSGDYALLSGNERVRRLNGKHYSTEQLFDLLERSAAIRCTS
jgi:hypothetical protein